MSNSSSQKPRPETLTVGDLITELCRWPDQATIRFRCPVTEAEFRFARIHGLSKKGVDLELDVVADSAPVVPA